MLLTLFKAFIVFLVTVVLSLCAIVVGLAQKSGKAFHAIGRWWSRFTLWIYGINVHVQGLEHLEQGRQYIYVSNHASMFDIFAVLGCIPDEIRIVLKKELARIPIFGWAMTLGPYIVIDRAKAKDAMKSLEEAAEKIRGGASVLLFAEGTRTRDGKLQPFKRGAFALAAKSGVPIVPVAINNTFGILPKGSWRIRPRDITMVLEKPIPTNGMEGKEAEKKLMEEVHRAIEKNYVEQTNE